MKLILIYFTVACGISNVIAQSRISGGDAADITQYPFATALLNNIGATAFRQVCGGTILTQTAILSAASCFLVNNQLTPPLSWRARVGSTSSISQGMLHVISSIIIHPQHAPVARENDIAVLRTVVNIAFGPAVQPAFIAGGAYTLATNEHVIAIGWGATTEGGPFSPLLRRVQLWVNNQQVCAERYQTLDFNVTSNMICAGWLDAGARGQCQGDTGGPLLHNNVVVGVYSWTEACGSNRFPNINTRVSVHSRWIEAIATVQ